MKTYKFLVSLCGGWCNGSIEVTAENEEAAYDKAMDMVVEKLVKAFPTLDIAYDVECENPDEAESYTVFKYDEKYPVDIKMFCDEWSAINHAKRWDWDKVVNDITGEVVWRKQ
jgi:hypothetical protein